MALKTEIESFKNCKLNLSLVKQAKDLALLILQRAGAVRREEVFTREHAHVWKNYDVIPRAQWTLLQLRQVAVVYPKHVTPEEVRKIAHLAKEIEIMINKGRR